MNKILVYTQHKIFVLVLVPKVPIVARNPKVAVEYSKMYRKTDIE